MEEFVYHALQKSVAISCHMVDVENDGGIERSALDVLVDLAKSYIRDVASLAATNAAAARRSEVCAHDIISALQMCSETELEKSKKHPDSVGGMLNKLDQHRLKEEENQVFNLVSLCGRRTSVAPILIGPHIFDIFSSSSPSSSSSSSLVNASFSSLPSSSSCSSSSSSSSSFSSSSSSSSCSSSSSSSSSSSLALSLKRHPSLSYPTLYVNHDTSTHKNKTTSTKTPYVAHIPSYLPPLPHASTFYFLNKKSVLQNESSPDTHHDYRVRQRERLKTSLHFEQLLVDMKKPTFFSSMDSVAINKTADQKTDSRFYVRDYRCDEGIGRGTTTLKTVSSRSSLCDANTSYLFGSIVSSSSPLFSNISSPSVSSSSLLLSSPSSSSLSSSSSSSPLSSPLSLFSSHSSSQASSFFSSLSSSSLPHSSSSLHNSSSFSISTSFSSLDNFSSTPHPLSRKRPQSNTPKSSVALFKPFCVDKRRRKMMKPPMFAQVASL